MRWIAKLTFVSSLPEGSSAKQKTRYSPKSFFCK